MDPGSCGICDDVADFTLTERAHAVLWFESRRENGVITLIHIASLVLVRTTTTSTTRVGCLTDVFTSRILTEVSQCSSVFFSCVSDTFRVLVLEFLMGFLMVLVHVLVNLVWACVVVLVCPLLMSFLLNMLLECFCSLVRNA